MRVPSAATAPFQLDATLWTSVKLYAKQHELSADIVLSAAFAVLLARYSGNYSLQHGVLLSNRNADERGQIVCRVEQILPLKLELTSRARVLDVCHAVNSAIVTGYAQSVPFERLVQEIQTHEEREQDAIVKSLFEFREPRVQSDLAPGDVVYPRPAFRYRACAGCFT